MLEQVTPAVSRAREHLRAAAERDPYAWPDGTVLVVDDGTRAVEGHPGPAPDGAEAVRQVLTDPEGNEFCLD